MSDLILDQVTYRYGTLAATDRVSLEIQRGEFFALLGPSGSGKSTILRLIAGFNTPDEGRILMNGEDILNTPVHKRHIGFVFQNFALFPHMTVEQNVAFGLESQHMPRTILKERVVNALELVQLTGLEKRRPSQLSGGQQQRVAFARAVVIEPRVLLLDEPLASLDRKLRVEMQVELRQLQQRLGITTIFVTHDQEEALTLADRVAVMKAGRIEQIGEPLAVYARPKTRFVAEFLGLSNIFTGEIVEASEDYALVRTTLAGVIKAKAHERFTVRNKVQVMVRPEQMHLQLDKPHNGDFNMLQAYIGHISYAGASVTYNLYSDHGLSLTVFEQSNLRESLPPPGSPVFVSWSPDYTFILDDEVA
jgi:spermidine/putrescine ABC transporter ATP-binding subunit